MISPCTSGEEGSRGYSWLFNIAMDKILIGKSPWLSSIDGQFSLVMLKDQRVLSIKHGET
jgi:hypothetical protein